MTREEATVVLGLDVKTIGPGLMSVKQKLDGFVHDFRHSIGHLAKEFGGAFMAGGLVAGIERTLEHFDELKNRSENLGISTDFLQGMSHIASKEITGGVETFNRAIGEMSVLLGNAKDGQKEAVEKFQKMGISIYDIQRLNAEEMFYVLADRIKAVPDPAQRAAMAFEMLGKSGKNMAGFMGQGAEEIKKLVQAVDKLDEKKIKDLADAQATIEDAKQVTTIGLGKTTGYFIEFFQDLGAMSSGVYWDSFEAAAQVKAMMATKKMKQQAEAEAAAAAAEMEAAVTAQQAKADADYAEEYKKLDALDKANHEQLRLRAEQSQVIQEAFQQRRDIDRQEVERFMPTLHELAHRGAFRHEARGIEKLDRKIKRDFQAGDVAGATRDIQSRDKMFDSLVSRGVLPERDQPRRIEELARKTEQHLAKIAEGRKAIKVEITS